MHRPRPTNHHGRVRNPVRMRKKCIRCGAPIVKKMVGVTMLPFNIDDSPHVCLNVKVRYLSEKEIRAYEKELKARL